MGDNPINITETGHKQEFVLSPGGEEFVEIVRLDEVNGEGKFDLLYAAEPKHRSIWASINKNTGPHDLTLVALGAPKPEYRKFRISVPLDGYLKFEDFGNPSAL